MKHFIPVFQMNYTLYSLIFKLYLSDIFFSVTWQRRFETCKKLIALSVNSFFTSWRLLMLPILLGLCLAVKYTSLATIAKFPVSKFRFCNTISFPIWIFRFRSLSFILKNNQCCGYSKINIDNNWLKWDGTLAPVRQHLLRKKTAKLIFKKNQIHRIK